MSQLKHGRRGDGLAPESNQSDSDPISNGNGQEVSASKDLIDRLSEEDRRNYDEFQKKLQLVRDRTTGVARGYATGFFLDGPGGVSKTFTVVEELRRMNVNYRLSNSRMTGRGLFDLLEQFPDCVHVLEDVESMMNDKMAIGVLRSALWGHRKAGLAGASQRWITWNAFGMQREILFTGGLILIGNRPMTHLPEIEALKTRVPCLRLQPGDDELKAMMRLIALQPFAHDDRTLDEQERCEVCEFVIAQSVSLHRPLDLRLLVNSLYDFLQWQEGDAGVHWMDLVTARVQERSTEFNSPVAIKTRAERLREEREIARQVADGFSTREQRREEWFRRTGKSEKSLYRRLKELGTQTPFSSEN